MKYILILLITSSMVLDGSTKQDFNGWTKKAKQDEFGDVSGYQYTFVVKDNFKNEDIYLILDNVYCRIFSDVSMETSKFNDDYSIRYKVDNGTINTISYPSVEFGGRALSVGIFQDIYDEMIGGEGKTIKITIWYKGNLEYSFQIPSFKPKFD